MDRIPSDNELEKVILCLKNGKVCSVVVASRPPPGITDGILVETMDLTEGEQNNSENIELSGMLRGLFRKAKERKYPELKENSPPGQENKE